MSVGSNIVWYEYICYMLTKILKTQPPRSFVSETFLWEKKKAAPIVEQPSLNPEQELDDNTIFTKVELKPLRSQSTFSNKNPCIICQILGGTLHKVVFIQAGESRLNVAQRLTD